MSSSASQTAPPKPIRFVQNSEGPYAKRRRINSACTTCRRRKTRCSGERPVCGTCIQNKHECGGYGNDADPTTLSTSDHSKDLARKASDAATVRPKLESPLPILRQRESQSNDVLPKISPTMSPNMMAAEELGRKPSHASFSQDDGRREFNQPLLSLSTRNRMPYFRYFGPSAIMPGFKQMVVKVRGKQHGTGTTPSDYVESPSNLQPSHGPLSPSHTNRELPATPLEIPIYDTSDVAPSPLITHLCQTFFIYLGCNFPFLQEERFMRDLEEKQVDAILVDAVCAIAARFSTHTIFTDSSNGRSEDGQPRVKSKLPPSEYGAAFAQRAHSAITDTFAVPSVAVVQAALLLAYNEFGSSRDSGLWMYLGISIRMAQDLGMQTLEGLKYEGRSGPTPKSVKRIMAKSISGRSDTQSPETSRTNLVHSTPDDNEDERRAAERERLDTFWAVFILDRVISSGTGRPVTLRDRDIEISFPSLDEVNSDTGWPVPFPALVRIIHLYGLSTDLLNRIREAADVTPDVIKRLGAMENQLTEIYQGLSSKLHFNAVNFQHYAKAGQGTNFILLHVWFHTLIVLLHQPTLLKIFEGQTQQLLPNSRELSMSSAKTITDILTFSELIDTKASVGSPFTSQPIYISACLFLKETALYALSSNPVSRPVSRPATPTEPRSDTNGAALRAELEATPATNGKRANDQRTLDQKQVAKHTLLATAANQNYEKCYRALQSLETYWAGVKYILTVLDQKAKGVGDPLLYTREEMESALEVPRPEPDFKSPGWRRKLSWGTYLSAQNFGVGDVSALRRKASMSALNGGMSPMIDAGQAIGWSLTGTMNSPSTSLAVLYPSENQPGVKPTVNTGAGSEQRSQSFTMPNVDSQAPSTSFPQTFNHVQPLHGSMPPPAHTATRQQQHFSPSLIDPALVSDADLLLNLHSPYATGNSPAPGGTAGSSYFSAALQSQRPGHAFSPMHSSNLSLNSPPGATTNTTGAGPPSISMHFGDMMIESQDIDVSALGDDMMPWLEYLPHDMLGFYETGPSTAGATGNPGFNGVAPDLSSPRQM